MVFAVLAINLWMFVMYIIIGIVAFIIFYFIFAYNGLVKYRNRAKEAWSDIDVQLKRRYDLIPNLVETVKGYAAHEKTAFENVTKARAMALGAQGLEEKGKAENMLTGALKSIFAIAEAYPQLKANENFIELQRELSDTENKIQAARRFYNSNIMALNTLIESFPQNIIAGAFKFEKEKFFEIEESAEKELPKVSF
ncbi:MAG: LemA family protein [Patescibacteria group bacterium]